MNIAILIPARMASSRFPGKPLFDFLGLPMIEHVRRRAEMNSFSVPVYVATCDEEIASSVRRNGGKVILTSSEHKTGSDRIGEAAKSVNASHIMVLQGDEPLILPSHIDQFLSAMSAQPEIEFWNALAPLAPEEVDDPSVVKAVVAPSGQIMLMCRNTPSIAPFEKQQGYLKKVLGVIGYSLGALELMCSLPTGVFEGIESIEQMRLIERGSSIRGVFFERGFVGVNTPRDAVLVAAQLKDDEVQRPIIEKLRLQF